MRNGTGTSQFNGYGGQSLGNNGGYGRGYQAANNISNDHCDHPNAVSNNQVENNNMQKKAENQTIEAEIDNSESADTSIVHEDSQSNETENSSEDQMFRPSTTEEVAENTHVVPSHVDSYIRRSSRSIKEPMWMKDYAITKGHNDLLITGSNTQLITEVKTCLHKQFKQKDLGELKFFLGIKVLRSSGRIILNQRKYILELIAEVGLTGAKPAATLMESNLRLTSVEHDQANGYFTMEG
uniref:Reverse transcriptase Ty1/copia-type domain-containing protein n=1 Tax=Solanum lycopersicum TaxID=4081 RepID=A0A3Q7IUG2_SOLLC